MVGWTLNYEVFFYLLFFGSLFLRKFRFAALFAAFALLHALFILFTGVPFLQSFDPYLVMPCVHSPYLGMAMNPMVLLFGVGILLGALYQTSRRWHPAFDLIPFAAATVGIVLMIVRPRFDGHGPATSLFCLLVFVAGLSLERVLDRSRKVSAAVRPLVYLGNISYSIYMLHVLFLSEKLLQPLSHTPGWVRVTVILTLTVGSSALSYHLIEKRFSNFLKRNLGW